MGRCAGRAVPSGCGRDGAIRPPSGSAPRRRLLIAGRAGSTRRPPHRPSRQAPAVRPCWRARRARLASAPPRPRWGCGRRRSPNLLPGSDRPVHSTPRQFGHRLVRCAGGGCGDAWRRSLLQRRWPGSPAGARRRQHRRLLPRGTEARMDGSSSISSSCSASSAVSSDRAGGVSSGAGGGGGGGFGTATSRVVTPSCSASGSRERSGVTAIGTQPRSTVLTSIHASMSSARTSAAPLR